ncbi:hypothetical protein J2W90_003184 [Bacillus pumilus]|nr:hypothetical protein [Bacillus pumilus]
MTSKLKVKLNYIEVLFERFISLNEKKEKKNQIILMKEKELNNKQNS